MDMKKILQAMDGVTAVSTSADHEMKRFVSIISEGKGSPQAEQMIVRHYSKTPPPVLEQQTPKTNISKYFKAVEQELLESKEQETSKKQKKAKELADRAINEIGGNYGHFSSLSKHVSRAKHPPDSVVASAKKGAKVDSARRGKIFYQEAADDVDSITLDVPLFIRLLEYAKEDAKTDVDLHNVAEKAVMLSKEGVLSMDQYKNIVNDDAVKENKDPCWNGYSQIGTKKKNNKTVPNCVPKK